MTAMHQYVKSDLEVIAEKRNERLLLVDERLGGGRDHVFSDGVQCETARMHEIFFHDKPINWC